MADASNIEPMLLLSDARYVVLQKALVELITAWRQRWSTSAEPVKVSLGRGADACTGRSGTSPALLLVAGSASLGDLLYVKADAEWLNALLGMSSATLDPAISDVSPGIARALQEEILPSLAETLLQAGKVSDPIVPARTSVDARSSQWRHGATVAVALGSGRVVVTLGLSARLMERLAPRLSRETELQPVVHRRVSLADEAVQVKAVLGDAVVQLADLARLAVGDVLVLEQDLSAPGKLMTSEGQAIANVRLGRVDDRLAVSVTR